MIVRFTVENYMSFKDETTLDFVSNSHIPFDSEHKYKFGRLSVLKNIGVFGANASGKTTIIRALASMRALVLGNHANVPICFKGQESKPTTFTLLFEHDSRFFEYSFSIRFNKNKGLFDVINESLYELWLSGKHVEIYSKENGLGSKDDPILSVFEDGYKNVYGKLFLTYMVAPERYIKDNKTSDDLRAVFEYFLKKIYVCLHENEMLFSISEECVAQLKDKLSEYDTGIESVDFVNATEMERIRLSSDPIVQNFILRTVYSQPNREITNYYCDGRDIFSFKKTKNGMSYKKLLFRHLNIAEPFSFAEESEGTRIIFFLVGTLLCSDNEDRTLLIDEIERSSHPIVVRQAIQDFQRQCAGSKAQLLFTSHQETLMDDVLKRDEIYFAEKDDFGASSLKSLQEYKTRNRRESVAEKYLEGRYGALPNIAVRPS